MDNRRRDNRGRGDGPGSDNIDGSKFRGGLRDGGRGKGSRDGGRERSNSHINSNSNTDQQQQQRERSSLKLAPRSRPVDDGKPSDGDNWRSSREAAGRGRGRGRGEGRGGEGRGEGRGGERRQNGRGEGGRGAAAGGRGKKVVSTRTEGKIEKSADGWDSAQKTVKPSIVVAPAPVMEVKKTTKKVTNAFAALGFDSDSD